MVKSFEFEARIRGRRALREKSTLLLPASRTNAPLRPTRRKSLERPAESFDAETEVWAVAAPWAIGVEKALSGPRFGRSRARGHGYGRRAEQRERDRPCAHREPHALWVKQRRGA